MLRSLRWSLLLAISLGLSGPVFAQASAAAPAPAAGAPDDEAPTPGAGSTSDAPEALLARARGLYEALEYDQVIPIAEAVLARENVAINLRLDAYLLQGSSMAIVGDPIEAEKPFRLLLRANPEFDMPSSTPPKILAVFRKVQSEENTIRDETNKALRNKLVASMEIIGEDPSEREGGLPLVFRYRVRDPNSAIEGVRIQYKKQGEVAYSSLALKRDDEGEWRGAIPGQWTASDGGIVVEYYLESFDAEGPLAMRGDERSPLSLALAAGTADRPPPPPLPLWSFIAVSSGAGAALVVGGVFTGLTMLAQADYTQLAESSVDGAAVDGADLVRRADVGNALMWTQWAVYGVAGAILLGAGVMAPFVNWTGEEVIDEY